MGGTLCRMITKIITLHYLVMIDKCRNSHFCEFMQGGYLHADDGKPKNNKRIQNENHFNIMPVYDSGVLKFRNYHCELFNYGVTNLSVQNERWKDS